MKILAIVTRSEDSGLYATREAGEASDGTRADVENDVLQDGSTIPVTREFKLQEASESFLLLSFRAEFKAHVYRF